MGRWGGSGTTRERMARKKLARQQQRPGRYPLMDPEAVDGGYRRIARHPVSARSVRARANLSHKTGVITPGLEIKIRRGEGNMGFEKAMRRLKRAQHSSKIAVRFHK